MAIFDSRQETAANKNKFKQFNKLIIAVTIVVLILFRLTKHTKFI